jgi:hypothetical protein
MASGGSLPTAKWITRRQAATLLGMTEHDLIRLDGKLLHPRQRADRAWLYDPDELRGVLGGGAKPANDVGSSDGDVTAAAFALFEDGKTQPQVVIATKQTAATIVELRREYDAMVGAVTLRGPTLDRLRQILDIGDAPVGEDVPDRVAARLAERYETGFRDGFEEAQDCGDIVDPVTGQRRPVSAQPD